MIECFMFDIGNVLLWFDVERSIRQMAEVCGCTPADIRLNFFDNGLMEDYERGRTDTPTLHEHFRELCRDRPFDGDALNHAASDIFTENKPMSAFMDEMRQSGRRILLLSNTNPVHFDHIRNHYSFPGLAHDAVLSYETGAMKPDTRIYEAALERAGCPPENCVYIDDIAAYAAKGRAMGLQAHHYQHHDDFLRFIRPLMAV